MALEPDFSGKSEFPRCVRAKVSGGEKRSTDHSPAPVLWAEISAKAKPSKISRGETGIHTRASGVCQRWRSINDVITKFKKTGQYDPGSGIAAGRGKSPNETDPIMAAAFARAMQQKGNNK